MDSIYFKTNEELDKYLDSHTVKRLGVGKDGRCVLLDNGLVAKKLWQDYYPDFALQFKDIKVPSFVFARSAAFVGDFVKAVFMEQAKGDTLLERRVDYQRMDTLGDHLGVLSKDIITLSDMGVLIKDFHCGNIVYDETRFRIIDTLPFLKLPNGKYKEENLREVMIRLYENILSEIFKYKKVSFRFRYYGHNEFLEDPKYYLQLLRNYIMELTEEEIVTVEDASMALKKKLKE